MSTRNHCWIILTTILYIVLFIFNQFHQAHCLRSHFVGNRNRSWCHGSRKLEHLRGRCMFHYECVKHGGISIGHCFQNFLVGSCCMDRRSMLQMMMMTMLEPPSSSRHPQPQRQQQQQQQQQHSQAIIDDDDGQNQNNFHEIQSKHLHRQHHRPTTVVSEELEILASGHPPIVKMDDFDAPTNPPPSSSSSSSTSSPSTNNMTTTIDADQNPIMAGMDNIDNCDDDGGGGPNVTDSIRIDRSSSSTEWPARLDESIRNSTTNTTSTIIGCDTKKSSSRPVMVNQNEFYEIVKDGNKSWTTPTITSTPPTSSIPSSLPPSNNSASIDDDDDDQKDSATAGTLNYNNNNNNFLVPNFIHLPPPIPLPLSTQVPVMMTTVGRSSKMCGVRPLRPTGRVVGGRNAQFGEWPWQVLIKEKSFLGFFTKSKCGGVLIDYKWVLTAAHCQPGKMGSLIVMAGQYELNQQHHQGSSAASGSSSSTSGLSSRNGGGKFRPVVRTVKRMIVHRDFDPDTFDNDIALLELDEPFEMQPHIVPICLPNQEEDYVGQFAYVTGWGKLSYGGIVPTVLQTVRLPIIDNHICQKMFADAGHYKYIRNSFLCAGYPQGGRDTCEGDSGGPLMMKQNDVWTLVGTVSHGIKCAEPNLPGVYTKTWAFLPWIRGIIDRRSYSRRLTL